MGMFKAVDDETQSRCLAELKARFRYRKDRTLDSWRILPNSGIVYGDCDDFAMTMAYSLSNRSLVTMWWNIITFKHVVWLAKTNGGAHAMLHVRGAGWLDNIQPQLFTTMPEGYRKLVPYPFPIVFLKLVMGKFFN